MNRLRFVTWGQIWNRAVTRLRLAGRSGSGSMRPTPPAADDWVPPRHYPPRSSSFLDNDLMNREMYNHVHEPTRASSRLAFRLRRS